MYTAGKDPHQEINAVQLRGGVCSRMVGLHLVRVFGEHVGETRDYYLWTRYGKFGHGEENATPYLGREECYKARR
jgi:hypothetical protein